MTPVKRSRKRKRRSLTPFSPTPTTTKGSPSTKPRGGFRCQTRPTVVPEGMREGALGKSSGS
ncbi:hypothetical protein ERO13_D06G089050v2 [Gossypium hirsutum]|nr:hypothetical protein ERO13_D06G089050v2 [Gossypium hirsutum]